MNTDTAIGTFDGMDAKPQKLKGYIQLMKPTIVLLFTLTGMATMVVQGALVSEPVRFLILSLALVLTAGSANAFNQYLDRDIDAIMERTRIKRPIPNGTLMPKEALVFSWITAVISTGLLFIYGNLHAAFWGAFTIFFYVVIYTMWLKRTTPYNIVIGGAAGATAPLIGWAAGSGELSVVSIAMFLVVFMWTPPHFWALALCVKDEYSKAKIPMLPVVAGEEATRKQILYYTIGLIPFTLLPFFTRDSGLVYLIAAIILGVEFIRRAYLVYSKKEKAAYWGMFGYSIVYLLALFIFFMVDGLIPDANAAEKIPDELTSIGIKEKFGDQIDLSMKFRNETGQVVSLQDYFDGKKPVVILLAYYGCPNLCNFFLNGATDAFKDLKFTPGKDYEIVTVSFDPRESHELASKKKNAHIKALGRPEAAAGWHFLVEENPSKDPEFSGNGKKLADSVGFNYRYLKERNEYAHAAAMIFATPSGKISRYLFGVGFQDRDMRLALSESSGNKIGNVVDRLLLFCYNYDPQTRKYSLYAMNLMRAMAALTVLFIVTMILILRRKDSIRGQDTNLKSEI